MSDADRKRLIAILGMLGSASAGERDNAARLAEQFRRQHGLTWAEMVEGRTVYLSREVVYVDRIVEKPVYLVQEVERVVLFPTDWPRLWRKLWSTDMADRSIAIAFGLIPITIVLASIAPHIRMIFHY